MVTNTQKMLVAVLSQLQSHLGNYGPVEEPATIYEGTRSENYLIGAISTIIRRADEGADAKEIYKEVNQYLNDRV